MCSLEAHGEASTTQKKLYASYRTTEAEKLTKTYVQYLEKGPKITSPLHICVSWNETSSFPLIST